MRLIVSSVMLIGVCFGIVLAQEKDEHLSAQDHTENGHLHNYLFVPVRELKFSGMRKLIRNVTAFMLNQKRSSFIASVLAIVTIKTT